MFAEKDAFEKKEETDIEIEVVAMEVDTMSKSERLERVQRRMKAWEASRICREILKGVIGGMERAVTTRVMDDIVREVVECARAAGNMNILVKEFRIRDRL